MTITKARELLDLTAGYCFKLGQQISFQQRPTNLATIFYGVKIEKDLVSLTTGTDQTKTTRVNQFQKTKYQRTQVKFVNTCFGGYLDLMESNSTLKKFRVQGDDKYTDSYYSSPPTSILHKLSITIGFNSKGGARGYRGGKSAEIKPAYKFQPGFVL